MFAITHDLAVGQHEALLSLSAVDFTRDDPPCGGDVGRAVVGWVILGRGAQQVFGARAAPEQAAEGGV